MDHWPDSPRQRRLSDVVAGNLARRTACMPYYIVLMPSLGGQTLRQIVLRPAAVVTF
jgi:hypothetical protein